MRTNYVLIDYQNVQPELLSLLMPECFRVFVFVGANQTKVPVGTAEALQPLGTRAEYIRISGNGPNALDFHMISQDTGFDPLIEHLNAKGLLANRRRDITEIPLLRPVAVSGLTERVDLIVERLRGLGVSTPKNVKTLLSTIQSVFNKQLSEDEATALLKELERRKIVDINNKKVIYAL